MPQINYAEKIAKKDIDNRLKRYNAKIIKCCSENKTPEEINIHFTKKIDILKADILEVYGDDSMYMKAINKLLAKCDSCSNKDNMPASEK